MKHMMKLAAWSLLLLQTLPSASRAEVFSGRVIDGGNRNAGIAGVAVTAFSANNAVAATALTDAAGNYSIEMANMARLQFDKLGYLNRKARRTVAELQKNPAVYLVKESADTAYYDAVAEGFRASQGDSAMQYAAAIVALPAAAREQITTRLDTTEKSLVKDVELANRVTRVLYRMDTATQDLVVTGNARTGTVQLSGFVKTPEDKVKAGAVAKDTIGIDAVKNDIKVKLFND